MTTDTNSPLNILLSRRLDAAQRAEIEALAPRALVRVYPDDKALAADIADADIVGGFVAEQDLEKATRLRWIHSWAAGPNEQLYPALQGSRVLVTCSKGNGAIPLAEHAMMLMLMLNREAMRWMASQRERRWERFTHAELNGLTLGIVGMGHAGVDLACKAKAFHMRVLGTRRSVETAPGFDQVFAREQIHAMLAQSDFVVVTAPLTPESAGMLGEPEFRAMKPSAYYICVSRGGIADDDTLFRALQEGWIAGAGLDAHQQEPLPASSRFWGLPNVIITPHNGATTAATRERAMDIFIRSLGRFVAGEPPLNIVDLRLGY